MNMNAHTLTLPKALVTLLAGALFGFGLSVANGFFLKTNSTNEAELRLNLRAYLDGDPKDASVIYIAGDFNQAQANPTIAAFRVRYLGNGQWSTASLTDAMNASHRVSASCLTPRMPARASSSCSSGPKKAILRPFRLQHLAIFQTKSIPETRPGKTSSFS